MQRAGPQHSDYRLSNELVPGQGLVIALWSSRKHVWQIISSVFALRQNDGLYRFAVAGGLLGFIFMLIFGAYAGLSPWVAAGYFLAYFVFSQ